VIAVAAVGMTFIIVSGGIDLSVGSVVALSGVYAAMMMSGEHADLGIACGLLVGLFTGLACGVFNGILITRGILNPVLVLLSGIYASTFMRFPNPWEGTKIAFYIAAATGVVYFLNRKFQATRNALPPFIATLGMMEIVRGVAFQSTDGLPITHLPDVFRKIGNTIMTIPAWGHEIMIPYSFYILIPLAFLAGFILKYTVFGVQVYAVGSNEQTARLCGVSVERVKLWVYMIGGLTAGLAGILHASRLNTGQPSEAQGMELEVIAAVVIGGGSLMGGEGTILGSVVGAFIIKFLRNGCNLVGVSPFVQRIVIGLIIIIAVYVDQLRRKSLVEQTRQT